MEMMFRYHHFDNSTWAVLTLSLSLAMEIPCSPNLGVFGVHHHVIHQPSMCALQIRNLVQLSSDPYLYLPGLTPFRQSLVCMCHVVRPTFGSDTIKASWSTISTTNSLDSKLNVRIQHLTCWLTGKLGSHTPLKGWLCSSMIYAHVRATLGHLCAFDRRCDTAARDGEDHLSRFIPVSFVILGWALHSTSSVLRPEDIWINLFVAVNAPSVLFFFDIRKWVGMLLGLSWYPEVTPSFLSTASFSRESKMRE